MSQIKQLRWLYDELPKLVAGGVLDAAAADRVRAHYGPASERKPGSVALLIFSVLGAALVGLGIILILANNWDELTRTVRAGITFSLLIGAQTIAGFIIARRPESSAGREASGLFLSLCAGAAIALIAQTYNIPGDLGRFLMTWMLLILPLMYLLDAGVVTIGYLAGITWWAGYVQGNQYHALWFYPMAAAALPHLILTARHSPYASRTAWMLWAACICAAIAPGLVIERALPGLWIPLYASLFGLLYLGGAFWFADAANLWQRPLHSAGALGLGVLALAFTFEEAWDSVGWYHYRSWNQGYNGNAAIADYVVTAALIIGAVALLVTAIRRRRGEYIPLGAMPILAVAGYGLAAATENATVPWLMFNGYVLAISVYTIAQGLRRDRLATTNAGMVLLATLIAIRFFDSELSFIVRGVVFIVLGLGFLGCNVMLLNRRRASA